MMRGGWNFCACSTLYRDPSLKHKFILVLLLMTKLFMPSSGLQRNESLESFPSCEKNTCSGGNTREFSLFRNCQCDVQCSKYGDCCEDSEHYSPSPLSACIQVGNWNTKGNIYVDSYYMVNTCPSSWRDEDTSRKCQNFMETIKQEPLLGHPITSRATNITYVNYHCAKCNNDLSVSSMARWRLAVTCGKSTPTPFPDVDTVLSEATVVDGSWIRPSFNATYQSCGLYVWRPVELLRRCHKNTIDQCPTLWKNATVTSLCESYTSFVYFLSYKPYRNPYCAICNKVKVKFLKCNIEVVEQEKDFPLLFDAFSDDDEVGRTKICASKDEAFDPLAKKCRHILWSIAGNDKSCHDNKTCNCSKFVLETSEYSMNDDFSARDLLTGKVYRNGEFSVREDLQMEICAEYEVMTNKFGDAMRCFTFIGLGVSMVGIVLHLLAFSVNPKLRNLSGKNLASLCVALLVAYSSFITGQLVQKGGVVCRISAVLTYYSFLASFCWLLMMAYDVWRTLRISTIHLRVVSREARWYVFSLYSVISWVMIPGVLVLTALTAQNSAEDLKYWPGFGVHNCWFGNRRALLVFFVVPIGVVMVLNVVLYVSSAYMICSASVAPSNKTAAARRNYKMFARLALLMGLTWVSGFVAQLLDMDVVWFIFIFLNAFQGLFIFIAFTLTQRVRNGIRSQVSGDTKSSSDDTEVTCWSWRGEKSNSSGTKSLRSRNTS